MVIMEYHIDGIKYNIYDPTGNITALVETSVAVEAQPGLAEQIMEKHPHVEQVGFVRRFDDREKGFDMELRMAGGEFCGNASMCAAVWYTEQMAGNEPVDAIETDREQTKKVLLRVSGTRGPVEVQLSKAAENLYSTAIRMPQALDITRRSLSAGSLAFELPVVRLEGISHIIIESGPAYSLLMGDRGAAEKTVREWCRQLNAEGLGLMFLQKETEEYALTPLVYVPGSGTVFWENSCASGSCAAAMYLSARSGRKADVTLREPGGVLRVVCDPAAPGARLEGRVRS